MLFVNVGSVTEMANASLVEDIFWRLASLGGSRGHQNTFQDLG